METYFALHGEDQLVPVGGEGLLVGTLAEVSRAQVAVGPALPSGVPQALRYGQVLLHVPEKIVSRNISIATSTGRLVLNVYDEFLD